MNLFISHSFCGFILFRPLRPSVVSARHKGMYNIIQLQTFVEVNMSFY